MSEKHDDLMEAAIRAVDAAREDMLLAKASDNTYLLRKVAISVVHGALLAEREATEAKILALLKNPAAVRINYLRGDIACQTLIDEAVLAERQRHSSVSWGGHRIDIAAFRQLVEEGNAFADTDPEAQFIADAENSCPHCGGSGHKDDVRPPSSTEER